jgi:hypothetical protein
MDIIPAMMPAVTRPFSEALTCGLLECVFVRNGRPINHENICGQSCLPFALCMV